jgi:uncharacterized protein (DUF1800 family)
MGATPTPWAEYRPSAQEPWDLAAVGHLHRRAGLGATWPELRRDLRDGPAASVDRFLNPPRPVASALQADAALRRAVLASNDLERLKAWWLYRLLYHPDSLREKLTLFWHGHFATSIRKVESVALMLQQNELLRRHALGECGPLLNDIVADPAMLYWLDGGSSRREQPNENFAREFLELFTLGPGHYTERDVREAARAFTGWVLTNQVRFGGMTLIKGGTPAFRFDRAAFDDGSKTFLGRTGRWGAADIVRIALEQPACAEFLCRKLYRFLVNEAVDPTPELLRPLAAELTRSRFSILHVVGIILRSRHFFAITNRRQKIKSPVEYSAGLLRSLEVPPAGVNLLALAAACDRQGQELFAPPNVRGWLAGRTWISSATVLERSNWAGDVLWGNRDLDMPPFDPLAWAAHHELPPPRAAAALMDLLFQGRLDAADRAEVVRAGTAATAEALRRALQLALHCPEFQLG